MSDYVEFTLLFGMFASAGITIMTNIRIELWCERWLERLCVQRFSGETANRDTTQPDSIS